jgi:hypothetical protein
MIGIIEFPDGTRAELDDQGVWHSLDDDVAWLLNASYCLSR